MLLEDRCSRLVSMAICLEQVSTKTTTSCCCCATLFHVIDKVAGDVVLFLVMLVHMTCHSFAIVAAIHQAKPAALEVKRINVFLEIAQLLRRIARAKRTQKRLQRLMCEQMIIIGASCIERLVAMRTLFLVDLAFLLALVLGELVIPQSTPTRKIFLALIAFVSFLFMNILNVLSQMALSHKLVLTTRTNKRHSSCLCKAKNPFRIVLFVLINFNFHYTIPRSTNTSQFSLCFVWSLPSPKTTTNSTFD